MAGQQSDLRWSVERRLEFIEFRLYWEGRVNRGNIVDTFGVSVNQSSTDINRYIGLAPDNLAYDKSVRTYVRAQAFSPSARTGFQPHIPETQCLGLSFAAPLAR